MMAVADHVLGSEPSPPELDQGFIYRRWGINALDLPPGHLLGVTIALNSYEAIKGWQDAGKNNTTVEWSKANPKKWELASMMLKKWVSRGKK